jgi:hypothetical protein
LRQRPVFHETDVAIRRHGARSNSTPSPAAQHEFQHPVDVKYIKAFTRPLKMELFDISFDAIENDNPK